VRKPGPLLIIQYSLGELYAEHALPDICQAAGETPHERVVLPLELADGRGGKGGGGHEKAWPSINHSILSGWTVCEACLA
jgi:hypothetical protein